jgi:hypothetical protein
MRVVLLHLWLQHNIIWYVFYAVDWVDLDFATVFIVRLAALLKLWGARVNAGAPDFFPPLSPFPNRRNLPLINTRPLSTFYSWSLV